MELHLDPAVLVGPDLLPRLANDESGLGSPNSRLVSRLQRSEWNRVRNREEIVLIVERCRLPGSVVTGTRIVSQLQQHVRLIRVLAIVFLELEPVAALEGSAGRGAANHREPRLLRLELQPGVSLALVENRVLARIAVALLGLRTGDGALELQGGLLGIVIPEGHLAGVHGILALARQHHIFVLPASGVGDQAGGLLPGARLDRAVVVGKREQVLALRVLEEVEDPFFLEEPRDEIADRVSRY